MKYLSITLGLGILLSQTTTLMAVCAKTCPDFSNPNQPPLDPFKDKNGTWTAKLPGTGWTATVDGKKKEENGLKVTVNATGNQTITNDNNRSPQCTYNVKLNNGSNRAVILVDSNYTGCSDSGSLCSSVEKSVICNKGPANLK